MTKDVQESIMAAARELCKKKTANREDDHWTQGTPNACLNCVIEAAFDAGFQLKRISPTFPTYPPGEAKY